MSEISVLPAPVTVVCLLRKADMWHFWMQMTGGKRESWRAQLAALEMTGDVICSTGRDLMNPDGTFTGKYIPVKSRLDYHELLKHNSINCSSVLILREVALEFPMEHDDSH